MLAWCPPAHDDFTELFCVVPLFVFCCWVLPQDVSRRGLPWRGAPLVPVPRLIYLPRLPYSLPEGGDCDSMCRWEGTNVSLSRRGASSSYSTALCLHALNTGLYSLGPCLLSSPGFYASRRLARFHPPRDAGFWHRTLCCCSTLSPRWNGSAVAAVH